MQGEENITKRQTSPWCKSKGLGHVAPGMNLSQALQSEKRDSHPPIAEHLACFSFLLCQPLIYGLFPPSSPLPPTLPQNNNPGTKEEIGSSLPNLPHFPPPEAVFVLTSVSSWRGPSIAEGIPFSPPLPRAAPLTQQHKRASLHFQQEEGVFFGHCCFVWAFERAAPCLPPEAAVHRRAGRNPPRP